MMAAVAAGCGDDTVVPGDAAAAPCTVNSQCDDGLFCNGAERCDVMLGLCFAGTPPCDECDEPTRTCDGGCVDADGDGRADIACGGDDCDDDDPNRFPGNPEVCDTEHHDEDCDPTTFGVRDDDGDGVAAASCCNADGDGDLTCGTDCDDSSAIIHPSEAESCDMLDNDCDGTVDEGVVATFWEDMDLDGRGSDAADAEERMGCTPPAGFAAIRGDCDDMNAGIAAGLPELCDGMGVDEDCDGDVDEGVRVDCYPDGDDDGYPVGGGVLTPACADPNRSDVGGCPAGFTNRDPASSADCDDALDTVFPGATEVCNYRDDDCDGEYLTTEAGMVEALQTMDFDPPLVDSFVSHGTYTDFAIFTPLPTAYLGAAAFLSTGAVELTETILIGYGPITFTIQINVESMGTMPDGGWSLFAYRESSSTTPANSLSRGRPRGVHALGVEWDWFSMPDRRRLRTYAPDGMITNHEVWAGAASGSIEGEDSGSQTTTITIVPDDPATPENETMISADLEGAIGSCDFDAGTAAGECLVTIQPGERWRFGTGFGGAIGSESVLAISFIADQAVITMTDACPPPP